MPLCGVIVRVGGQRDAGGQFEVCMSLLDWMGWNRMGG